MRRQLALIDGFRCERIGHGPRSSELPLTAPRTHTVILYSRSLWKFDQGVYRSIDRSIEFNIQNARSIDRVSTQTRTGPVPTPPGRAHQRGRASVHAGPAQLSDSRTHTWLAGLTCGERGEVPYAQTRPSATHRKTESTLGVGMYQQHVGTRTHAGGGDILTTPHTGARPG